MRYGVGFAGTGYMAAKHAAALREHPRARLVAAAGGSSTSSRAREFAVAHGIERVLDGLDQLLADDAVEIVFVCSPDPTHADFVLRSLAAGKHVFCEKPLAQTAADLERIENEAVASGRVLQVGMNCRFRAQYVNVKERIDTELGELRFLRGTYVVNSVEAVRSGQKPWHREYPEGYVPFLYSGALHCLDLMRWIAGPIRAAWARAAAFELAQEWGLDTFSASLLFSGGAIGELTASASAFRPPDFKLEAWFANGSLVDGWEFRRAGEGLDPKGVQLAIDQPKIDVAMQFDDMLEAIETERAPLNSAREARENFRVLTAIHRSALDGGPVQVGEPTGPDHDPIGELYGDP